MTAELRERVAKAIFKNRGTWSTGRANELFAIYHDGPKNLEPEFADEIKAAFDDATTAISIFDKGRSARLDDLECRIKALEKKARPND